VTAESSRDEVQGRSERPWAAFLLFPGAGGYGRGKIAGLLPGPER
jgi:hypothetical protein